MALFDGVTDEYDVARPGYPEAIFDALGPLDGAVVVEGGPGTGIASRQLLERGARLIGIDVGSGILRRAIERSPELRAVQADAARLPIRDGCVDLICFAQSWHWVDRRLRASEAHRVLLPRGRWAAWWSHARGDDEDWFDGYWNAIEAACPGTNRSQRDTDWGRDLAQSGLFTVSDPTALRWVRRVRVDLWLTEHRSHSNIATLDEGGRQDLLDQLEAILKDRFVDGTVEVTYETRLWLADRVT